MHGTHGVSSCTLSGAVPPFLTTQFRRPMSLVSSIFGSDDDGEILNALYTIANASQTLSLSWTTN